jgi:hypothetical protein
MFEARDFCDRPPVHSRAEPDDEYDARPDPLDPRLIGQDDERHRDLDDDEELRRFQSYCIPKPDFSPQFRAFAPETCAVANRVKRQFSPIPLNHLILSNIEFSSKRWNHPSNLLS